MDELFEKSYVYRELDNIYMKHVGTYGGIERVKQWLLEEYDESKEPPLSIEEKGWLESVCRPFTNNLGFEIDSVEKDVLNQLIIDFDTHDDCTGIYTTKFYVKEEYFKRMKIGKKYSEEELQLEL